MSEKPHRIWELIFLIHFLCSQIQFLRLPALYPPGATNLYKENSNVAPVGMRDRQHLLSGPRQHEEVFSFYRLAGEDERDA